MSLKNLIALQNKKQGATSAEPKTVSSPAGNDGQPNPEGDQASGAADGPSPDALPRSDSPAPEAPAEVVADKPRGLGLNLVGAGRAVGGGNDAGNQRPVQPALERSVPASVDSGSDDGAVFSLDDLAEFDASDDSAPERPALGSGFDDEIEATAPDRPLDPSLTTQQQAFIESLDGIYPCLHDPELFGQAVRMIMLELQENKEYKKLLADQDVHTMIRGMRNTMGLARIRKMEKSRKTGTAGKRAAKSKSSVSDEDMALLNSVLGDFGD